MAALGVEADVLPGEVGDHAYAGFPHFAGDAPGAVDVEAVSLGDAARREVGGHVAVGDDVDFDVLDVLWWHE
jgi:hypothetical protein